MRKILSLAIALSLPMVSQAADPSCEISFEGASLNVCSGKFSARSEALKDVLSFDHVKDSSLRLVKFNGPITKGQRAALESAGAQIVDYAPHYAFIVKMPASTDHQVKAIDGVVWTGPMLPAMKIDPNLYSQVDGSGVLEALGVELLSIGVVQGDNVNRQRASLASISGLRNVQSLEVGGEVRFTAEFDRATLTSTISQLALNEDVVSIGVRKPVRASNSQAGWLHQSGVNQPSPYRPVFDQGIYGCGQIVGVLDTGLYQNNVAFRDSSQTTPVSVCDSGSSCAAIASPNNAARKVIAYYKWSGDAGTSWADEHGHGTHVAGSILGNNNSTTTGTDCTNFTTPGGFTDLDGTAPGAKLVMQESGSDLRYLNNTGGTAYHAGDIAYQNGARLHNNSWGGGCTNMFGACVSGCEVVYDQEARDADRVMVDRTDLLMLFAAGNDATACPNGNNVGSPGNSKNVLTVGATNRGTSGNAMASFSSRGPTKDARTKPDISTQGSSIISAGRSDTGTVSMSGTSMATPTAAGLAALVREYLQRGFYPTGIETSANAMANPTGALIKAIMVSSALPMTGSGAGTAPGQSQGFGRVTLDDVLYFDGDQRKLHIEENTSGISTGEFNEYYLTVMPGQPLSAVLTWTDVAAAVGANPAIVNSLRLEVEAPNGDVWTQKLPAGFNVNNANPTQDTSTSNYDTVNTVHRLVIATPETGLYRVRVRGINVPQGDQGYALVLTGNLVETSDPDFIVAPTTNSVQICSGDDFTLGVNVLGLAGYVDPVTLNALTLPGTATGSFSVNPVIPALPANSSQLTVSGTTGLATGQYPFLVEGVSGSLTRTATVNMSVQATTPTAAGTLLPANGATGVPSMPSLSWEPMDGANEYRIQVATDSGFSSLVYDGTTTQTNLDLPITLGQEVTYFWRVTGMNSCGEGTATAVSSFTTASTICFTTTTPIPDGSTAGVNTSLTLSTDRVLADLKLSIKATHSYVGDLKFTLSRTHNSQVDTTVAVDRPGYTGSGFGCSRPNVDIVLSDDATTLVESQCNTTNPALSGEVKPNNPLSVFDGESIAGTWTLTSSDNASGDTGTLTEWCLIPTYAAQTEFSVGGTITGLTSAGLTLSMNSGAEVLAISAGDSAFTFDTTLGNAAAYNVVIDTQPQDEVCSITSGSGVISNADVTDIAVTCLGEAIFKDGFED